MSKTPNGSGEQGVTTEEAVAAEVTLEDATVTKTELKQPEDESKEKFDASDLLTEVEDKPTVSDEQRAKDKEIQKEKFNLSLKFNMKKVEIALDEGTELEDALGEIPEHLRGHVKGIVSGAVETTEKVSEAPDELVEKKIKQMRDQ